MHFTPLHYDSYGKLQQNVSGKPCASIWCMRFRFYYLPCFYFVCSFHVLQFLAGTWHTICFGLVKQANSWRKTASTLRTLVREKCPNTEFFLVRIFPHLDWIRRDTSYLSVFSPNAGKYGPEKTTYLETFHVVQC